MHTIIAKGIALNFTGAVPEWVTVLPKGPLVLGRDGRRFMVRNAQAVVDLFTAQGVDIPVDINHATEIRAKKGNPAPAVGWIKELRVKDEGQLEARVEWTDTGRNAVASRGYRYLSPAIVYDKQTLEVAALSSVALVTHPNLTGLPALNHSQSSTTMDEEQLQALCAALGLKPDATPEAILAEAGQTTALCAALGIADGSLAKALQAAQGLNLDPLRQELGLGQDADLTKALNAVRQLKQGSTGNPDLAQYVPRVDFDAAKDKLEKALNRVEALETATHNAEVDAELEKALNCGQITPASVDFYRQTCQQPGGLQKFRDFLKSAPSVAAPSSLQGEPPSTALNHRNPVLAAAFGNSADDLAKYGA